MFKFLFSCCPRPASTTYCKTCDWSNKLRTILPTDQFRALFNNIANNVTLPLGALKVHEKSIRGSRVDWSPETLKNMFRGFVPFPVINS